LICTRCGVLHLTPQGCGRLEIHSYSAQRTESARPRKGQRADDDVLAVVAHQLGRHCPSSDCRRTCSVTGSRRCRHGDDPSAILVAPNSRPRGADAAPRPASTGCRSSCLQGSARLNAVGVHRFRCGNRERPSSLNNWVLTSARKAGLLLVEVDGDQVKVGSGCALLQS
jgi:hypothetical protein